MCCDRWTTGVFIGLSCRSAESPWKSRRSFEASAYISSWITIVTEKESLIIVLVKIHVKCDALNLIRRNFWHLKNPRSCTIIKLIVAHFPGHLTLHEYFIFSRFALGLTCSSICNNFTWTSIGSATRDPWLHVICWFVFRGKEATRWILTAVLGNVADLFQRCLVRNLGTWRLLQSLQEVGNYLLQETEICLRLAAEITANPQKKHRMEWGTVMVLLMLLVRSIL